MARRVFPEKIRTQSQRDAYVRDQAYDLAATGNYAGWLDIEDELRKRRVATARSLLDDENLRDELNGICRDAIARRQREAAKSGEQYTVPVTPPRLIDPTLR